MNNDAAHILTDDSLTVFVDGNVYQITSEHPHFEDASEAVLQARYDEAIILMSKEKYLADWMSESKALRIEDGEVFFKDYPEPLKYALADHVIRLADGGYPTGACEKFIANLLKNPSYNAVSELYTFLEACRLPLTEDGQFLAYKVVRDDWKDYHSGKIHNGIGEVVSMPRNQVDDRRENTCSYGLHVCSREYLHSFYGSDGRLLIVKVHPQDVVSVPNEYNNSKMRVCRYEVIQQINAEDMRTVEEENVRAPVGWVVRRTRDDGKTLFSTSIGDFLPGLPSAHIFSSDVVARLNSTEKDEVIPLYLDT